MRWIGALVGLAALLLTSLATADPLKLDVRGIALRRENGRVMLTITVVNAQAFAEFTTQNVGRRMEFRTDGKPVVAPIIREPILGGQVIINFATYAEASAAAERLRAHGVVLPMAAAGASGGAPRAFSETHGARFVLL